MVEVYPYKEVFSGSINLYSDGTANISSSFYALRGYGLKGQYAVFNAPDYNPKETIQWRTTRFNTPGSTVFISPKSKLSRDIVRNSGYKITYDASKADVILIPVPYGTFHKFYEHLWAIKDDCLYLAQINKAYYSDSTTFTQEQMNAVITVFANALGIDETAVNTLSLEEAGGNVHFMPKVEEYVDILKDTYRNRTYCFDSKLKLNPSSEMNVETLEVMAHMNNNELLCKAILNSDWQNYPLSINLMLSICHYGFERYADAQTKIVLSEINYFDFDNNCYNKIKVTPEDWKMSQDWLFYHNGIQEDHCAITKKQFNSSKMKDEFVRHRVQVVKTTIPSEMTLNNILEMIKY